MLCLVSLVVLMIYGLVPHAPPFNPNKLDAVSCTGGSLLTGFRDIKRRMLAAEFVLVMSDGHKPACSGLRGGQSIYPLSVFCA